MVMIEELTPPQSEDDEPLQLEENELLLEENNDEDESLLSPPRGWPECFSTSKALKSFIELELGGRRVRLSEPPADEHAELAEGLGLRASDALTNALRLRSRYGWDVRGGFILFDEFSKWALEHTSMAAGVCVFSIFKFDLVQLLWCRIRAGAALNAPLSRTVRAKIVVLGGLGNVLGDVPPARAGVMPEVFDLVR